jgi:methylmalonyl-CoA mutase N-terminal domain/subunit
MTRRLAHEIEAIAEARRRWEKERNVADIPRASTESGVELKPVYTPDDIADTDYLQQIGLPGEYPFTRGIFPGMYRKKVWTMRQYAGFGTAEETNERWKFLLNSGQPALSCAFDLPTQMGYDSDNPDIVDEVGLAGVAIDTLRDFEILYQDLPMNWLGTSFTINSTAPIILAMYVATAEKQGVRPQELIGTVQNDILKEYVARGTWLYPPEPSVRLATDIVEYCTRYMPRFYPISIASCHMRDAGGSMSDSIGFSLSNAITYVQSALDRGLDVDEFAPRLTFIDGAGPHIFEEVAKFRAVRRIWARIMKERFEATDRQSMCFRFAGGVGGSYFRAEDPDLNLVRGAYGALALALAGVQSMLVAGKDEAFAIPTEETARLALATQQVLAEETDVTRVVDPLGGSYYVEALTNLKEKEIMAVIEKIESLGGSTKAIEIGYMQKVMADGAFMRQKMEESGELTVVGANKYAVAGPACEMEVHEPDPESLQRQLERLKDVKNERNYGDVSASLKKLRSAAADSENLMPCIIDAVKAYATVGEISSTLKDVFGEFKEPIFV